MATKSKEISLLTEEEEAIDAVLNNAPPVIAMIQDNPNLIKDLRSHAVVNRDNSSYTAAVASKHYHRTQRNEVESLKEKIDNLERLIAQLLPGNNE